MNRKYIFGISLIMILFIFVGCDYFGPGLADYNYDLTSNYKFSKSGTACIWKSTIQGEQDIVKPEVIGIRWNNDFILAKQNDNGKINYWIVDVKADKVYGPLNQTDFESKKKDLKVDKKLTLDDPEKYKSLEKTK